ncbi:MAG TPA: MASE1 domain-containing protein [Gemmatimonadales bacterium]|nr:MASE1 domain-containing protein [Gemmatimonadales bacterium]
MYVAVARLGLQLDPVSRFATFVWPPTGLSLAALLLFGSRLWPGVALGAVVANVLTGAPLLVAGGIAVGNTLEALIGASALSRIPRFRRGLDRVVDVLALIGVALASSLVSATIGVARLSLGGVLAAGQGAATWMAWWQGDVLGDLVVAPFLLTWVSAPWYRLTTRRAAEAVALGVAILGASWFLLSGSAVPATGLSAFRQPTTLLPLLIWAGLRFGTQGASAATLLVSAVAIWSTALGHGPFIRPELHDSLAVLQAFMSVVAVTFLVMGAVTAERRRADRERTELYHRERLVRAYAEEMRQRHG